MNNKCLLLTIGYNDHVALPLELLPYLDDILLVEGDMYSCENLKYTNKNFRVTVVNRSRIEAASPDPAKSLKRIQDMKAKVQQELSSLEREEALLSK